LARARPGVRALDELVALELRERREHAHDQIAPPRS
jgi:hypothetical protein